MNTNTAIESALRQATLLTFGELCLTLPVEEVSLEATKAPFEAEVRVGFHGTLKGELIVRLFGFLLEPLAQGMTGSFDPVPLVLQKDALGEIGNVICGNVLPLIGGADGVFRLDPPRPGLASESLPQVPDPQVKTCVGLDGGRADVGVFIEDLP